MLRRLLTLVLCLVATANTLCAQCPDNEIWYTTTDGKIATLSLAEGHAPDNGADFEIVSHTYDGGKGVIRANKPIKVYGFVVDYGLGRVSYGSYSGFALDGDIESITLPHGLTTIAESAFEDCSSLASITIPEGVTQVGDSAFFDCSGLKVLTCKAPIPPRVLPGFLGFADLCIDAETQIYVPKKSVKAYKNNYIWGRYAKRIKPIK